MQLTPPVSWRSRLATGAAAIALAAGLTAGAAMGAAQPAYAAADVEGYVTASSYRAAEPAPEMLGISNIGTNDAWGNIGQLKWSSPLYYIMGTDYNSNPNPYYVNSVNSESPSVIYYNRAGGPFAAMYAYQSGKDEKGESDKVWESLPDIILGTGNAKSSPDVYEGEGYAPAVAEALGVEYNPIGVTYDNTDIYTMIDVMYNLAAAADKVVAESNGAKQLRYGEAMPIAQAYEEYVLGTQGWILKQLNGGDLKKICLVSSYDAATGVYYIIPTGKAEGTATANRYLEAVQDVAVNIANDGRATEQLGEGRNAVTVAQATAAEVSACDLVLLGSQAGSENIASTEDILASFPAATQAKTFWVNSATGDAGSMYGVVMNSVENAQNTGRILGCLYPEYVDQDDWICYYYEKFYHIADGKLAEVIDNAMDGVRNWDATSSELTSWTAADASTYDQADVSAKLKQGMAWIDENPSKAPERLAISDHYTVDHAAFSDVADGAWYAAAVRTIAEKGLIRGEANTSKFSPSKTMTRAQLAAILWRYAEPQAEAAYVAKDAKNTTGMSDVKDGQWYTGAANWAVSAGVIHGSNGKFNPNGTVDRETMVTILANMLNVSNGQSTAKLDAMPDGNTVDSWAKNAMAWALNEGVVNGVDKNGTRLVAPKQANTRAVAAGVLYNAFEKGLLK